jgi:hypothetical protein
MHCTISQRRSVRAAARGVLAILVAALVSGAPHAQTASGREADRTDPFRARSWHLEVAAGAAGEAWNYNTSREELYGVEVAMTYGVRDGLVVRSAWPLCYVSQRGVDGLLLGATIGLRARASRLGRGALFAGIDLGVSQADTFVPPRGTRFNYLVLGGGGATVRIGPNLHLLASLRWIHVSNNGVAGRSRNPDIEAIGAQGGVLVAF